MYEICSSIFMPLEFLGVRIYEPMTVLTNFILTGMCWYFFKKLKANDRNWALFFLFLACSTFFAAIGHGYADTLDNPVKFVARIFAILSVMFGGVASIRTLSNLRSRNLLTAFMFVQSLVFLGWLIAVNTFVPIKLNSVVGLGVIVLGIHLYHLIREKAARDLWIVTGILVSASAAIVNTYQIGLSPNFTYHDVGHVVMMVGLLIMYQGISKYALSYVEK